MKCVLYISLIIFITQLISNCQNGDKNSNYMKNANSKIIKDSSQYNKLTEEDDLR